MYHARIASLQARLAFEGGDAVLLSHLPDIRWACGFTGSNGMLLVRLQDAHFLTDGRYATQAHAEVQGAHCHISGPDLIGHATATGLFDNVHRVIFQADHLSFAALQSFQEKLPHVAWIPRSGWLNELKAVKDAAALKAIRQAQAISETVFEEVLALITPGISEQELAAEIVYRHLRRGAERMAFDPIVASGPNSALPHARPTKRRLRRGDVVVLDFGCYVDGYASDMTRTVVLGPVQDEVAHVYQCVVAAQEAALAKARSGISAAELDQAARAALKAAGLEKYFTHSLGHGVGLEVHEWPRIAAQNEAALPSGVVITIEPGVYLPERFGVRLEDLIVLTPEGYLNLTHVPKTLYVL